MRHSTKDNYLYLTTTPVPRLIVSLAVPTIISMLVTSFYNMADTYFVGKINTQSTAAVGIVFSVMSIIQAVGFFFGHGSGNYISRKLGAQETGNAEKMAATGFFWALFMGIFLAVVGLIFLTPLSLALGSTPTILPYTEKYLGCHVLFGFVQKRLLKTLHWVLHTRAPVIKLLRTEQPLSLAVPCTIIKAVIMPLLHFVQTARRSLHPVSNGVCFLPVL